MAQSGSIKKKFFKDSFKMTDYLAKTDPIVFGETDKKTHKKFFTLTEYWF